MQMDSFIVFFRLAGAVALLLFALRLVGKGMTDAFGVRLKMVLGMQAGATHCWIQKVRYPRHLLDSALTRLYDVDVSFI